MSDNGVYVVLIFVTALLVGSCIGDTATAIQQREARLVCAAFCLPATAVESSPSYCVCEDATGNLTAKKRP